MPSWPGCGPSFVAPDVLGPELGIRDGIQAEHVDFYSGRYNPTSVVLDSDMGMNWSVTQGQQRAEFGCWDLVPGKHRP